MAFVPDPRLANLSTTSTDIRLRGRGVAPAPMAVVGGGDGGSGLLHLLGKVMEAPGKGLQRAVMPFANEVQQGIGQIAAALGSDNAQSYVDARNERGIRGFNLKEIFVPGKDNTGQTATYWNDPTFQKLQEVSPIAAGTLKFVTQAGIDPLNFVGVGTARTASQQGTKLTAKILLKDVLGKTSERALLAKGAPGLLKEGGEVAAKILGTTGSKNLGAALREIDKIPEAKAALEFAGHTTERGLMIGGGGLKGTIVPGTAKIAEGIDRANNFIRNDIFGVSKIVARADAKEWQLGRRASRIRGLAAEADKAIAAGVPTALDDFRAGVTADFSRSVVQGTKTGIFKNLLEEARDTAGIHAIPEEADKLIETEIRTTMRPSHLQRLKGVAPVLKGSDGYLVKSYVTGRMKGVVGGGDRTTVLGKFSNQLLDDVLTKTRAAGLTHTVMMNEKGKLVEVAWDDIVDGVGESAELWAKNMENRTLTAGTPTALEVVWRIADRASADLAAVKATGGGLPDALAHAGHAGPLVKGEHWAHMTNQVGIGGKEFFTATEQIGSIWKSLAVARPGFSNRNYWGGLANNLAYGVGVRWHKRAAKEAEAFLNNPLSVSPDTAHYIRVFGSDVTNRGVNAADIAGGGRIPYDINPLRKATGKAQEFFETGANVGGRNYNPLSFVRTHVGGAGVNVPVELNLRLAAFLKFTDDGLSPEAAMALVDNIHFDYQDLSKLDKSVKTIYPFWTWRSRNIGLQAGNIARGQGLSRGMVNAMVAARLEHEGEPFPPFLQGLQVPFGGGLVGSSSALPVADLISRIQDVNTLRKGDVGDALRPSLINEALPQLQLPFELLARRDSFTGAAKKGGWYETLDALLQTVPGTDLLPSPFPGTGRGSSVMKRSSVSDTLAKRILENFLIRQTGIAPGDVRDYSDTVN